MKERSLTVFSLLAQMAVGAFWTLGALYIWLASQAGEGAAGELTRSGWLFISAAMVIGLVASFFHLGAPANAWRACSNVRQSWLSREILFAILFAGASIVFAAAQWLQFGAAAVRVMLGVITGLVGLALIYVMGSAYRLRTVPAWNTWLTPVSFFVTTFLLGALAVGVLLAVPSQAPAGGMGAVLNVIALWAVALLGIELVIIPLWLAQLTGSEAAVHSAVRVTRQHGALFKMRLALAVAGLAATGAALVGAPPRGLGMLVAFGLVLASEVLGRLLFYAARVRHGV